MIEIIRDLVRSLTVTPAGPALAEPVHVAPIPVHLRHTVPVVEGVAPARLPDGETLADLRSYEFGCVGLCMGDACPTCAAIADQIGEARCLPDTQRGAREADLMQQITALKEGRC